MKPIPVIARVKTVRPKRGRAAYHYYDTGRTDLRGKKIYAKLPAFDDPSFWPTYGSYEAARNRRTGTGTSSLGDLIALYRKGPYRKLNGGSPKIYDIYLRQIVNAMGVDYPADDITPQDIQYLFDLKADKPGAANMIVRVGSALFGWASGPTRKYIAQNPCAGIDLNELGEHAPWPDALLDAGLAAEDPLVRLAVHLLYYTGQRIGDCTMMRWTDIRDGRIEITQEKTGKWMSIPRHPALAALLDDTPRTALTLLGDVERGWLRESVLQPWAAALGYKIVPHGLRKNAVNALLEAECSVAEVSSITGQSLALVEHYAKGRNNRKLSDSAVLKWSKSR